MASVGKDLSSETEARGSRYLVIVVLCSLIIVITSIKHVWSVFIPYVEAEFMVTRSVSVLPFSLLNAANVFGFLSTNYLKEVLGLRKLLAITAALMSLGLILSATSPNVGVLIVSFAFMYGLGHSFGYVLAVSLGVKWFQGRKAGVATGIIVSAYSLGVLTLSPITTYLIQYFRNWRVPLLIYGAVAFAVMATSVAVLREPSQQKVVITPPRLGLAEVIMSKKFTLIATALFLTTLFDGLIVGNLVPLVEEMTGVGPMTASLVMSIYSATAIVSRVVIGAVSEYSSTLRTLAAVYALATTNALFFSLYRNLPLIILGTSISAILFSANITLTPLIASHIWGTENLEAAYGPLLTAMVCGVLVGPIIGGLSKDLTGSYYPGITLAAVALLLGTLVLAYAIKYLRNITTRNP